MLLIFFDLLLIFLACVDYGLLDVFLYCSIVKGRRITLYAVTVYCPPITSPVSGWRSTKTLVSMIVIKC